MQNSHQYLMSELARILWSHFSTVLPVRMLMFKVNLSDLAAAGITKEEEESPASG